MFIGLMIYKLPQIDVNGNECIKIGIFQVYLQH